MKLGRARICILFALIGEAIAGSNPFVLPKFVMFGDSITEFSADSFNGFALFSQVQYDYLRRLEVVNRGFKGYTTAWATYMIDKIIDADTADGSKIELMTIFFGANDAATNPQQHVPLDAFKKNLDMMTKRATSRGIKVILVGPGLVDQNYYIDRSPENFLKYNKAVKEVAEKHDVGFVDMYHALLKNLGWQEGDPVPGTAGVKSDFNTSKILLDGLHFTGRGYRVYYDELVHQIRTRYPESDPINLHHILPGSFEVNNNDIEKSLYSTRTRTSTSPAARLRLCWVLLLLLLVLVASIIY